MKSEQKNYDLHIHSKYSSCSNNSIKAILKRAKKVGLNGIAVTDHNEIKGAFEAKKSNKDKNFEIVIASEIKTDNGDVLAYYINEQIKPGRFEDVVDKIHKQGGLAAIAHPYAEMRLHVKRKINVKVDAVESFNPRTLLPVNNIKAERLAERLKAAKIAGSDSHFIFEIGTAYTLFDGDLRKSILKRKTSFKGRSTYGLVGGTLSAIKKRVLDNLIKQ
jgi:predicted metal-dependent phosphoesterase TrpH